MQHEVLYGPAYALGVVSLEAGESVQAEAGAMVSMTPGDRHRGFVREGRHALRAEALGARRRELLPGDVPGDAGRSRSGSRRRCRRRRTMELTGGTLSSSRPPSSPPPPRWSRHEISSSRSASSRAKASSCWSAQASARSSSPATERSTRSCSPSGEQYTVDTGHMVAFDETVAGDALRRLEAHPCSAAGPGVPITGPGRFFLRDAQPGAATWTGWCPASRTTRRTSRSSASGTSRICRAGFPTTTARAGSVCDDSAGAHERLLLRSRSPGGPAPPPGAGAARMVGPLRSASPGGGP